MKLTQRDRKLVVAATRARKRCYAPYSRFGVGAALELEGGTIVTGVNVENCSYGLTVCAERNALTTAVGKGLLPGKFTALAVVTEADAVVSPCGACRQVLAEFGAPDTRVVMHNLKSGETQLTTLGALLPHSFTPLSLPR